MKINILTPDSKRPNLAAMKISTWHQQQGDEIFLNFPLSNADFIYASVLFDWTQDPYADLIGGSKYPAIKLDPEIDSMRPDYSLYPNIDYSLGYTYKACPRTCDFCIVPKQHNDETHYSIWTFHEPKFKKLALLNNNTLADPQCRETFQEIINANLTYIDMSGFDLRLMTEEIANWISKLKIEGYLHCAWDFMEHEVLVMQGLKYLQDAGIKNIMCYILIGYNTTPEEDLYRIEKLGPLCDPFVMPFNKFDSYQKRFARWVNHKAIFKSIAWKTYK